MIPEPGQEFSGRPRTIDQAVITRYAGASGDYNPIHLDAEFAARTPFGGTIAHGMLLLAYLGEMMEEQFGARWLRESALKVRFRLPARPGDSVTAHGRIERTEASHDGREYTVCAVRIVNERGEVLISGEARVMLRG